MIYNLKIYTFGCESFFVSANDSVRKEWEKYISKYFRSFLRNSLA